MIHYPWGGSLTFRNGKNKIGMSVMEFNGGVVFKRDAFFLRHRGMSHWALGVLATLTLTLIIGATVLRVLAAQDDQDKGDQSNQTNSKPKVSKEERRRQKAIQKEYETPYKKWLSDEVPYIITDTER